MSEKTLTISKSKLSELFKEWIKQCEEHTDSFSDFKDENGKTLDNYGDCCAEFVFELNEKLNNKQ